MLIKCAGIHLMILFQSQFWDLGAPCSSRIIQVFTPERRMNETEDYEGLDPSTELTSKTGDYSEDDHEFDILEVLEDSGMSHSNGSSRNSSCLGASCASREIKPQVGRPEIPIPYPVTTEMDEGPEDARYPSARIPGLDDIPGVGDILGDMFGGGDKPHCLMYGTCDITQMTTCPSNGSAASVPPSIDATSMFVKLEILCLHLVKAGMSKVCCTQAQLLAQNGKFLATWTVKAAACLPCAQNLIKLFCEINCAPDQSLHGYVMETGKDSTTMQKTTEMLRYYITEEYAEEVFQSCRDTTGVNGKPLIESMCHNYKNKKCTAERFFEGLGMSNTIFEPLKVSFGIRKKDRLFNVTFDEHVNPKNVSYWPLNTTSLPVAACEDGNLLGIPPAPPCSCENCRKACPKTTTTRRTITFGKPRLPDINQFLPSNVPGPGFWRNTVDYFKNNLWALFSIQFGAVSLTFLALMGFACFTMKHLHAQTCERARKRITRIRHREATNRFRFWEFHRMYMQQKAMDEYAKKLKQYNESYNENNYSFNDQPGYNSDFRGYGDFWRLGIDLAGQRVWLQNSSIDVATLREEKMTQTRNLEAELVEERGENRRYKMRDFEKRHCVVEVHDGGRRREQEVRSSISNLIEILENPL